MKAYTCRRLFSLISFFVLASPAVASTEWSLKRQLNLEAAPLDISSSSDGKLVYVLVPGKILIYSVSENKVIDFLSVDKSADMLISGRDNSFIVSNTAEKTLKVYQLETRQKIDITGLPYKGPGNAPILVAVYSDYQ